MRVIALGFFDGVHLGHGTLLRRARLLADERGCAASALTFDSRPESVLSGAAPEMLSTLADREALMRELYGIDEVLCRRFDRTLMNTPYDVFVRELLCRELGAVQVVCGYDYRFGKGGEGTPEKLAALCGTLGVGCECLPKLSIDRQTVCSTYIRTLIAAGDMERAARFLGHPHRMSGAIVPGQQLGRTIGVPTANLAYAPQLLLPASGVYAVRAQIGTVRCTGVCNVGERPTVHGSSVTVETWLEGVEGDLYGRTLTLEFYKRLRGERKFDSLDALRQEILKNRDEADAYFAQQQ